MPVSLHTHSWFSLLEGTTSPEALLGRAAELGYSALALTDTNNLYGAIPFFDAAANHGIRPLLGVCLKHQRSAAVVLVADPEGYRNLCRVLSRLHLGIGQPVDLATLLCPCATGLHVLTGDVVLAERLRDAFADRLWMELARPARSLRHEADLLEASGRLGLRLVATTATHMARPEEYEDFRLVAAVRQTTLLERIPSRLTVRPEHHLVDRKTLHRRFSDYPQALRNAEALAELLRSDVLPRDLVMPRPRLRAGMEEASYLRRLCERGLRLRGLAENRSARDRLQEELALLEPAGMAGYFLVVRDIARYTRRRGHGMALRGSAGNSLVCYLLEITNVNPLRFGLTLERFLHEGRRDLPDIDLDFDWKVRDEVMDYVRRRHGSRFTAQISTHQYLQTRSAFRASAKVHGLADAQIRTLLDSLSERLETAMAASSDTPRPPRGFPLEPDRWPHLLADARRLLGRPHHLSIHPGGIVLTPRPIEEYAPLEMAPKGVVITQFEKDAVERVGLVKIDLLGNRALATVDETRRIVASERSPGTSVSRSEGSNADIIDLLRRGETLGVNQLESPAMRHLLIQVRPHGIDDLILCLALLRPGAASEGMKETYLRRRRGLEPIEVLPVLAPLLRETLGLLIYEDDALRVLRALVGLSAADADRMRKKAASEITEEESRRLCRTLGDLCERQGTPRCHIEQLWPQMRKFRHYAFCKSHAVSYGLIAWEAVTLKARHPCAFWAAALNNNQGVYPRRVYIEAVRRAGIPIRRPCVNHSQAIFTVEGETLRVGLGAVAGLSAEFVATLLEERTGHGPFLGLDDLRRRLQPGPETLSLLIRCGALDFTGAARPRLALEAELAARNPDARATALFTSSVALGTIGGWVPADDDDRRRYREEWDLLGFVTGVPLLSLFHARLPRNLVSSRDLGHHLGRRIRVAGLVATARHTDTADGRPMQFVTLEDAEGLIEVTLFPGVCPPLPYLRLGPYIVGGVVEDHYGVLTVAARTFELVIR